MVLPLHCQLDLGSPVLPPALPPAATCCSRVIPFPSPCFLVFLSLRPAEGAGHFSRPAPCRYGGPPQCHKACGRLSISYGTARPPYVLIWWFFTLMGLVKVSSRGRVTLDLGRDTFFFFFEGQTFSFFRCRVPANASPLILASLSIVPATVFITAGI